MKHKKYFLCLLSFLFICFSSSIFARSNLGEYKVEEKKGGSFNIYFTPFDTTGGKKSVLVSSDSGVVYQFFDTSTQNPKVFLPRGGNPWGVGKAGNKQFGRDDLCALIIMAHNKDRIDDPTRIPVGTMIEIPSREQVVQLWKNRKKIKAAKAIKKDYLFEQLITEHQNFAKDHRSIKIRQKGIYEKQKVTLKAVQGNFKLQQKIISELLNAKGNLKKLETLNNRNTDFIVKRIDKLEKTIVELLRLRNPAVVSEAVEADPVEEAEVVEEVSDDLESEEKEFPLEISENPENSDELIIEGPFNAIVINRQKAINGGFYVAEDGKLFVSR